MKRIEYSEEKSKQLKLERGISFEDIVLALKNKKLIDQIENPSKHHTHQKIFIININNYAFVVPFTEDSEKIFLKTLFPSRKYTRKYLKQKII